MGIRKLLARLSLLAKNGGAAGITTLGINTLLARRLPCGNVLEWGKFVLGIIPILAPLRPLARE
jgi:hypothetical protein